MYEEEAGKLLPLQKRAPFATRGVPPHEMLAFVLPLR